MDTNNEPNRRASILADELNMQADFEDSVVVEELDFDTVPAELIDEFDFSKHTPPPEDLLNIDFDNIIIRD